MDSEYPNSLPYDRSSSSQFRYFNFEQSFKLRLLRAWDFDGLQIPGTSGEFKGFSRRFLGFEILKLQASVCISCVKYELILENYCNSLLVSLLLNCSYILKTFTRIKLSYLLANSYLSVTDWLRLAFTNIEATLKQPLST